ncbi:uncharacterized protein LOC141859701 isoform X2 [Acropora palmata]|uniref:uncharacterized protein LOC141859701 isoform X2 n=1 Tax=Acropora palmata TaxID=6131 RepID=UPI003DA01CE0
MKLAFSKLMAWVNITSFLPKSIPIHQKFWLDLQEKSFKRLPLRFFALSFIQEIGHWPSFFCNQCMMKNFLCVATKNITGPCSSHSATVGCLIG